MENKKRNRYYGLRVGDIVNAKVYDNIQLLNAKILELNSTNNNSVLIDHPKLSKPKWWIAEHCKIVTKVENKIKTTK